MKNTVFQDDLQRIQYEERKYREEQLQAMMQQFIDAYGRSEAITLIGMVRKATHERVVINNPMKAIREAYKGNIQEATF